MAMLPLEGVTVLDLSRTLPGPLATQMLADFGADVIKIEDTRNGDEYRGVPPLIGGVAARHLALNRNKRALAIDLKAQARYVDVFSIMPYHARFGHATDAAWISRQTAWLGAHLGIRGTPDERIRIWPIVQLADWGESVPSEQVSSVLDHGTRLPATGVLVFHWGSLRQQNEKLEAMGRFYRAIQP